MKNEKIPYYLDEHGIVYTKIRDGPNIFHAIMVPTALQPYIGKGCLNIVTGTFMYRMPTSNSKRAPIY